MIYNIVPIIQTIIIILKDIIYNYYYYKFIYTEFYLKEYSDMRKMRWLTNYKLLLLLLYGVLNGHFFKFQISKINFRYRKLFE